MTFITPLPSLLRTGHDVATLLPQAVAAPRRAQQMAAAAAEVGQTPSEPIYTENKLELRRYEPIAGVEQTVDVPVVIVYAIINRPYILDLQPDRSVVRRFLERGFDVYLIDWGEPSRLDAPLGFGDYADRYLGNCVEAVCDRTGSDAVNLLGYCTGGTFAAIFAALYPERVNALGLLAPVLDFDAEEGIFRIWGRDDSFDPQQVIDTFGSAPGDLLEVEFSLLDPGEYYLARYLRLLEHLDDETFVKRFARRLRWGADTVDVTGEIYRQFLMDLYRKNKLMTGELTLDGKLVDRSNVTMPVLDVLGTDDRFIPASASRPFMDAIPSDDTTVIEFPTGHVGLSIADAAHEELWSQVCNWFAQRS